MKKLIMLIMLMWVAAVLLIACSSKDKVQDFIPGTYVRSSQAKSIMVLDTVMIWQEAERLYHILHKQAQRRKIGKQRVSWKRKRESWMAMYLPDKQILVEREYGLVLTFNLDRGLLLVNGQAFHRIDDGK